MSRTDRTAGRYRMGVMNLAQNCGVLMMIVMMMAGMSCSRPEAAGTSGGGVGGKLPAAKVDLPKAESSRSAQAVLAGGCFWCVEAVFQQLDGVTDVVSGYAGGSAQTAQYDIVSTGGTDHAEVVQITYDPMRISFGELLRVFFATHDPTTKDRQGPDWGRQYRSAIFYADEDQNRVAQAYISQLEEAGVFDGAIVTTLEPLDGFYTAEQYHQDFVDRNPDHPYVRQWAAPKLRKVEEAFGDRVK